MNLRHVLTTVLIFSLFACSGGGNNGTITDLQPDNVALGITKDNIFYPGELGISTNGSEYLSQNGLATVVAEIKSIEGSYYNEPAIVTFTSDKVKEGLATIDSLEETVNGITQVTYSPLNFTGVDTIYARTRSE